MAVYVRVRKLREDDSRCLYAFGGEDARVGRVAVDKTSGDVILEAFEEGSSPPDGRFYLAQVIPRLQQFHEAAHYPDEASWAA